MKSQSERGNCHDHTANNKKKPSVCRQCLSKLYIKTPAQKRILDAYYLQKDSHEFDDLQKLSSKTGLTTNQVYKYLWNLRKKDCKKQSNKNRATNMKPQNLQISQMLISTQKQVSKQQAVHNRQRQQINKVEQKLNKLTIGQKVQLKFPQNVIFAKQYYVLRNQQIPSEVIDILSTNGFQMSCQI